MQRLHSLVIEEGIVAADLWPEMSSRITRNLAEFYPTLREISFVRCSMGPRLTRALLFGVENIESIVFDNYVQGIFAPARHDSGLRPVRLRLLKTITIVGVVPNLSRLLTIGTLKAVREIHLHRLVSWKTADLLLLLENATQRLRSFSTEPGEILPGHLSNDARTAIEDRLYWWMIRPTVASQSASVFRISIGIISPHHTAVSAVHSIQGLPVQELAMAYCFDSSCAHISTTLLPTLFPSLKAVHVLYVGPLEAEEVHLKLRDVFLPAIYTDIELRVEKAVL
ncbi:hypothetical protein EUX98_g6852 [Antrodiella citrinella]|uniref:F-box domain-containing protein n=1 Tax=Antrodiella citrinella TaxID=2447956 RepID=A0A4S4MPZ9_9APHY|nr:hypothetical protein EUX98_g6852 [Antrodiella citrinella]